MGGPAGLLGLCAIWILLPTPVWRCGCYVGNFSRAGAGDGPGPVLPVQNRPSTKTGQGASQTKSEAQARKQLDCLTIRTPSADVSPTWLSVTLCTTFWGWPTNLGGWCWCMETASGCELPKVCFLVVFWHNTQVTLLRGLSLARLAFAVGVNRSASWSLSKSQFTNLPNSPLSGGLDLVRNRENNTVVQQLCAALVLPSATGLSAGSGKARRPKVGPHTLTIV